MGIFISVEKTIECIVTAAAFSALLCGCCYKLLGILQSCGYSGNRLVKWAGKKNNLVMQRHILLAMLCALAYAVIAFAFSFAGEWAAVTGLASFVIFLALYIWADNKVALRTPVTATPRFKRLYAVLSLVTAVLVYLAVTLLNFGAKVWCSDIFGILRYCPLALFPVLMIPLVLLANLISKIYEVPHNKKFVKKATAKMQGAKIKVVGITGSYGKTSTKQILTEILSKKFRVLSTPRSHNTPMGLALSINNNNLEDYDIFIAEMGARHVGDVAELCAICPPDYSIITGICPQHLESFGTIENVVKAKGEILQSTKAEAVIARDCYELFEGYSCPKCVGGSISGVKCTSAGTTFTLTFWEESTTLSTKLLGKHAAENIALAAEVAYKLGMSVQEIAEAVEGLDFIEHRLQLIQSNGVNILDDGYNSNVRGAAAAIEVLNSFEGRKIVVTPGLVELGILEESENKQLGARLVGLDYIILVGETLVLPVKQGYIDNGGQEEKLIIKPTLSAAQEELKKYLQQGDTVLFLNDLPDIY